MWKTRAIIPILILASGCRIAPDSAIQTDLTFQRGSQLLATGSPKTAIPLLTQVVASVPDGPEPHAMLSLAYALDLQSERAIAQAAQVKRKSGEPPGWERMAVGIAELARGRPDEAVRQFDDIREQVGPESPMRVAISQWLIMALLLREDHQRALELLDELALTPAGTTALLWRVLVYSRQGDTDEAVQALTAVAGDVAVSRPAPVNIGQEMGDHMLYDAAIRALGDGDLEEAEKIFDDLQQRHSRAYDAPTWLALIAAADGDWTSARSRLDEARLLGSMQSRGIAHQLHGVVYAMERMPEQVVRAMVVGQRLLGRGSSPAHAVTQPKPDRVWFSDAMK